MKKFAALRAELKAKGDYAGLSKLPRNASPTRLINRCALSGRRQFGISANSIAHALRCASLPPPA